MNSSYIVEPALQQHDVQLQDAGAQTLESRRPVKDFFNKDRFSTSRGSTAYGRSPPRTAAASPNTFGRNKRLLTPLGKGTPSRAQSPLNMTMPARLGVNIQEERKKKSFSNFCQSRNIRILPMSQIQRDTFVTHYDRQELEAVERLEEEHRSDLYEAMIWEYEDGFTFLSKALWEMHEEVLATRREQVDFENQVRKVIVEDEERARVPISHQKCLAEYSYKYLEQILKRGAILEDDMKRERKMTARDEDQRRKFLLQTFRSVRAGIEKKEANNIRHMNVQATSFAKAAAAYHSVCYELQLESPESFDRTYNSPERLKRGLTPVGGQSSTTKNNTKPRGQLIHSPATPSGALLELGHTQGGGSKSSFTPLRPFTGTSDGAAGIGHESLDHSSIQPSNWGFNPGAGGDGGGQVVETVISPLSPVSGTVKHSLKRTQFIQEFLASRPALYTKKSYAPTSKSAKTKKSTRSGSSLSTSGGKRSSSVGGKRENSQGVDTHSLAPTIPYWLYRVQNLKDLQRALFDRLDGNSTNYLSEPTTRIPVIQQLPQVEDLWQRLSLVFEELRIREEEQEEQDREDPLLDNLEMIELSLTAAAILCKVEDPRRSIMLISECLIKLEHLIQSPALGPAELTQTSGEERQRVQDRYEACLFKFIAVSFYNAAMALAMLPSNHESGGGGSSTTGSQSLGESQGASGGAGRKSFAASSRRKPSRWQMMDDVTAQRMKPVDLAKLAAETAAVAFGPFSPFALHLQEDGVSNVLQMDVLPPIVLPPTSQGSAGGYASIQLTSASSNRIGGETTSPLIADRPQSTNTSSSDSQPGAPPPGM